MFVFSLPFVNLAPDMQTPDRNSLLRELKNHLLFLKDAGYSEIPRESNLFTESVSPLNASPRKSMTDNEKAFVKALLEMEMDGLPMEKKDKVMEAFHSDKITFENLQASLDKIATWHPKNL